MCYKRYRVAEPEEREVVDPDSVLASIGVTGVYFFFYHSINYYFCLLMFMFLLTYISSEFGSRFSDV